MLRSRAGEPVTYAELQDAGIEFPASLISELELAGIEVERCHRARPGERPVRAVRLPCAARAPSPSDRVAAAPPPQAQFAGAPSPPKRTTERLGLTPQREKRAPTPAIRGRGEEEGAASRGWGEEEGAVGASPGWGEIHVYRGSARRGLAAGSAREAPDRTGALRAPERPHRRPSARLLAFLALLAAIALTVVLIVTAVAGGRAQPRLAAQHHPSSPARARSDSAASRTHTARAPSGTRTTGTKRATSSAQAPSLPATPVSPSLASELAARGHSALAAGQYSVAVPVLERAVAATGERISACLEPTTENCLIYAYALYDLGRALLLSGHAASAVAVLEQRLQIDNQRPEVAAQLALARQG